MEQGRPKGDIEIRQIRAWLWYVTVKRKSQTIAVLPLTNSIGKNQRLQMHVREMTDYELDVRFDPEIQNKNEKGVGAVRRKMFEAVRVNGSIPSDGKSFKCKRPFNLIETVENDLNFRGTAAIIDSPLWRLLENPNMPVAELRSLVVECVKRLGLDQLQGQQYFDDLTDQLQDYARQNPGITLKEYLNLKNDSFDIEYDEALTNAFTNAEQNLDLIAIISAFALEANLAGKTSIAFKLETLFQGLIEEYCSVHHIGLLPYKYLNNPKRMITINLGAIFRALAFQRIHEALMADKLKGLLNYNAMFGATANQSSAIIALLNRHQRLLWRS